MRDKLTKKRVKKADYLLIVQVLGLNADFEHYLITKKHIKSVNRKALYFLKSIGYNDVALSDIYADLNVRGLFTFDDWLNEAIRIAKTPWLDDEND